MSSQIIRVPALLTELDVPAPSASLYLRRNAALLTRRALALAAGGGGRVTGGVAGAHNDGPRFGGRHLEV